MNYIHNVNTGNYNIMIKIKDPLSYLNTSCCHNQDSHTQV